MSKRYFVEFFDGGDYEPSIDLTIKDGEDYGEDRFCYVIEIKDNESLVECFKELFEYPFYDYVPQISVREYNQIIEEYRNANMEEVFKNLDIIQTIQERTMNKNVMKKIFDDVKDRYGEFYQRIILFGDYLNLILDNEAFIEEIKEKLTKSEIKVIFKSDEEYDKEIKRERLDLLKKRRNELVKQIKTLNDDLKCVIEQLRKLGE